MCNILGKPHQKGFVKGLFNILILISCFCVVNFSLALESDTVPSLRSVEGLSPPIQFRSSTKQDMLANQLQIMTDPTKEITIESLIANIENKRQYWSYPIKLPISFKQPQGALWGRAVIKNPSSEIQTINWLWEGREIEELDFYQVSRRNGIWSLDQESKLGDHRIPEGFNERHRQKYFSILLLPQETAIIFFRINTKTFGSFNLSLWNAKYHIQDESLVTTFLGMLFGILFAMIVYNSVLYFVIKDTTYLYYVCYVASCFIFQLYIQGYWQQLFLVNTIWLMDRIPNLAPIGSCFFAMLFIESVLSLKHNNPKCYVVTRGYRLICVLVALSLLLFKPATVLDFTRLLVFLISFSAPILGYLSWRTGKEEGLDFIVAWTPLALGTFVLVIALWGIVPYGREISFFQFASIALESVLLSFVLARRINRIRRKGEVARKEKEIAQKQAVENLKKSDQLKDRFMSTIGHELRTPMNGVICSLEMLEEELKFNESARDSIESAENSAHHMQSLIDDILFFSEAQSGKLTLAEDPFFLNNVLESNIDYYKSLCEKKGLQFRYEMDKSADKCYLGDRRRLVKLLSHLLDNAVKFTNRGCVQFTIKEISSKVLNPFHCAVQFSIVDTGIGIPKEKQNLVFESFSQADDAFTRTYGGLGIGLALCHEFVKAMEGNISFTSSPQGTRFDVVLFFRHDSQSRIETNEEGGTESKSLDILIVEDNPVNQMLIGKLLSKAGHSVTKANDGQEALDVFRNHQFDLILMDCQMPVMDGYQATEEIRKIDPELPIIAVTANALEADRKHCFDVGMNDFMSKPIKKTELYRLVRKWGKSANSDSDEHSK
jgi:signal transduction histidine kinase/CheY-like chemotaxis protein